LCYLGVVHQLIGDYHSAVVLLQRATELFLEVGNQLGIAHTAYGMGIVRSLIGDRGAAAALLTDALIRTAGSEAGSVRRTSPATWMRSRSGSASTGRAGHP
jgi:DNA-directed RNA polymerase specialized sigma24 family protein